MEETRKYVGKKWIAVEHTIIMIITIFVGWFSSFIDFRNGIEHTQGGKSLPLVAAYILLFIAWFIFKDRLNEKRKRLSRRGR